MLADHGQLDSAEEVHGELVIASRHGSSLLEPAHTALDDIAAPVLLSIEVRRAAAAVSHLIASLGDDRADAVCTQPTADALVTVAARSPVMRCGRLRGRPTG